MAANGSDGSNGIVSRARPLFPTQNGPEKAVPLNGSRAIHLRTSLARETSGNGIQLMAACLRLRLGIIHVACLELSNGNGSE